MTVARAVDLVVLGGGTANKVASNAAAAGKETVLIEKGPLGGTCLNRGCNPSKMLIQHANRRNAVADADRFGIDARVRDVDFPEFVEDVMLGQARTRELMTPVEVANLFVFGFSSHAGHLDGGDLLFDGGYTHTYE